MEDNTLELTAESQDVKDEVNKTSDKHGESKSDKFLRIAPSRVDKVVNSLKTLKKLSVRGSYNYTEEQVQEMFAAIKEELSSCEAAFKPKEKKEGSGFSFSS